MSCTQNCVLTQRGMFEFHQPSVTYVIEHEVAAGGPLDMYLG